MIVGVVLLVAGVGILWASRDAGAVNADLIRWRAQRTQAPRLRRTLQWQARVTPRATVWYGRVVAALAFVGGIILLVRG